MIPVLGFCGASNSGKTTLLCGVVEELCRQGYSLGVLKHHGHPEPLPAPDVETGKDTCRFQQAGAQRVALVHAGGVRLESRQGGDDAPRLLAQRHFYGLDLALVEGFKTAVMDKIEVVAPGCQPLLPPGGRLLALTRRGGSGEEAGLPVLDADQPAQVAQFVLAHLGSALRKPVALPEVSVTIDGVPMEINPFVKLLLDRTLRALVGGLKGGQGERIEVRLG